MSEHEVGPTVKPLEERCFLARPHEELIAEILDSRRLKTEREHAAAREIEKLRAENARLRKLLEDCQYALEYAADMTKPEGLSGCDCPICTTTIALHKELEEKA